MRPVATRHTVRPVVRHRRTLVRADPPDTPDAPPPAAPPTLDPEARLAALERGARRGKGTETAAAAAKRAAASAAAAADAAPGSAPWRDGALLPDGFDAMPLPRKLAELYAGRRGVLYWLNQAAWFSAIGVGVGWILFRFVLPGVGLYKLANGLTDPPV